MDLKLEILERRTPNLGLLSLHNPEGLPIFSLLSVVIE